MTAPNSMWIGQQPTCEQVCLYQIEGSSYYLTVNAFKFRPSWRSSSICVSEESALHASGTLGHAGSRTKNSEWGLRDILDYKDRPTSVSSIPFLSSHDTLRLKRKYLLQPAEHKDFHDLPRQLWAKPRQPKSNLLRNVEASALDVNCLSFFSEGDLKSCLRNISAFCQHPSVSLPWILWQLPLWYPERETNYSLWAFALSFSSGGINPWTCTIKNSLQWPKRLKKSSTPLNWLHSARNDTYQMSEKTFAILMSDIERLIRTSITV